MSGWVSKWASGCVSESSDVLSVAREGRLKQKKSK